MIQIDKILWLTLMLIIDIHVTHCNESLIQINFKRSINEISDRFVSFIIEPKYLLNGYYTRYLSNTTDDFFDHAGPAYIRLNMSPELKFHDGDTLEEVDQPNRIRQIEFGIQEWKNLHRWTQEHNFVAVIQLEYDSATWKARDTLRLLGVANDIGIKDCVWQLGSELNDTGVKKYIDDFKAFETMVKVFPEEKTNWKVIPANFKENLSVYDTSLLFNEVKDVSYSTVWQQEFRHSSSRHQNIFASKDTSLKYLLKQDSNVWLNVIKRPVWSSSTDCASLCIQDGLQWAQLLGDASRTGFQTVFQPLAKRDLIRPNYQHYISRLFKHLIGNKVFSVTGLKGDKYLSHYYTFCSKNQTGGFVLMVVNAAESRLRTEFKLTLRHKKSVVRKYILTVCDGEICLNDKKLHDQPDLSPVMKKKNVKRSVILSVPPQSVSFFDFPYANIGLCQAAKEDSDEVDSDEVNVEKRSSMGRILKDLAIENLNHERRNYEVILPRIKRQLGSRFKDLNLFKPLAPPPKLPPPPPPPPSPRKHHLNNGKILLSKPEKAKIPGISDEPTSVEKKIFASRENTDLPRGEMYLFVGPDTISKEPDYDYVEFDQKQEKQPKPKKKVKEAHLEVESEYEQHLSMDGGVREASVEVDSIDTFLDDFGGEFIRPAPNKRKNTRVDDREISEIIASKDRSGSKRKSSQKEPEDDENTQYAVLVKELAPTVRQNQINRKKAEKKLAQMALGEEEQARQVQTKSEEVPDDYEYVNEDDERFFSSDEQKNESSEKKKRNSPSVNRVDSPDKPENTRFMKAFEKLLHKIEKKVAENAGVSRDDSVRTRRAIDSVHVPKRKTRKSVRTTETGKQISKAKPIDIKNIAARSLNQLRRKRQILDFDVIHNSFYEVANEIEEELETEPKVYIKQLKHFHIEPSTNAFNISAEFVVQPKLIEKLDATTEQDVQTEFTTTIITPIETTTEEISPITSHVNVASVFDSLVQPFIDFYNTVLSTSKDLWKNIFQNDP